MQSTLSCNSLFKVFLIFLNYTNDGCTLSVTWWKGEHGPFIDLSVLLSRRSMDRTPFWLLARPQTLSETFSRAAAWQRPPLTMNLSYYIRFIDWTWIHKYVAYCIYPKVPHTSQISFKCYGLVIVFFLLLWNNCSYDLMMVLDQNGRKVVAIYLHGTIVACNKTSSLKLDSLLQTIQIQCF